MTIASLQVAHAPEKIDFTTIDERDLVAQLVRGNEVAWREFVRQYEAPLRHAAHVKLRIAMRTLLPSDCVGDVVQEFYAELLANDFRKLRIMSAETTLARWLTMLIRQTAVEHIRAARRQQQLKLDAPSLPRDTDNDRGANWIGDGQAERVPLHEELPKKRRRRRERELD